MPTRIENTVFLPFQTDRTQIIRILQVFGELFNLSLLLWIIWLPYLLLFHLWPLRLDQQHRPSESQDSNAKVNQEREGKDEYEQAVGPVVFLVFDIPIVLEQNQQDLIEKEGSEETSSQLNIKRFWKLTMPWVMAMPGETLAAPKKPTKERIKAIMLAISWIRL